MEMKKQNCVILEKYMIYKRFNLVFNNIFLGLLITFESDLHVRKCL